MPTLPLLLLFTLVQAPPATPETPRLSHEDSVQAVAFSPRGKHLVSAGIDRSIRLWDLGSGELVRTIGEHEGRVQALRFTPDGTLLASCGLDGKIHLWDIEKGQVVRSLTGHQDAILAIAISPDGQFLASASLDQSVRVWDVRTGKLVRKIEYPDDSAPALAFSNDGREIFVGFNPAPKVRAYSLDTGKITRTWNVHRSGDLTAVVTAGRYCFAALASGTIWRYDTLNIYPPERFGFGEGCLSLAASPDGKLLLIGNANDTLQLVEVASLGLVREFEYRTTGVHALDQKSRPGLRRRIRSVCFSPTTAHLAAGNDDSNLRVWRLTDLISKKLLTAARLTDAELRAAWDALGGEAGAGYIALAQLATYPEQAIPFVAERLKPAPAVDEKQVRAWIEQLNDDEFAIREKAQDSLRACSRAIETLLREVHQGGKLPIEAARRVGELLEPLSTALVGEERLREQRLVLLLQVLESAAARKLLETLSQGGAGSALTLDARETLRRSPNR